MTNQPPDPDITGIDITGIDITGIDIAGIDIAGIDRPVIEITVAAPVDTVWQHLRDPELIRRWHGWDDPGADAEIDFIYRDHAHERPGHVLALDRGDGVEGGGDRFELTEVAPDVTRVTITRGPRTVGDDWAAMYDEITGGWISFLAQLRFAVEHQPGVDRRTVFLSAAGPVGPVRATARLRELAATAPVWFRTEHQTGVVVAAYGPGLVLAADQPHSTGSATSAGAAMMIVSTFGLDDATFAAVERDWRDWWNREVVGAR